MSHEDRSAHGAERAARAVAITGPGRSGEVAIRRVLATIRAACGFAGADRFEAPARKSPDGITARRPRSAAVALYFAQGWLLRGRRTQTFGQLGANDRQYRAGEDCAIRCDE